MQIQLNSTLFAKTLVRKDVASSAAAPKKDGEHTKSASGDTGEDKKKDDNEFSSKAQVMTLMTTDVDRVSEFSWHIFTLVDSPIEIVIASVSCSNLTHVGTRGSLSHRSFCTTYLECLRLWACWSPACSFLSTTLPEKSSFAHRMVGVLPSAAL
jgi:hypothetical protein